MEHCAWNYESVVNDVPFDPDVCFSCVRVAHRGLANMRSPRPRRHVHSNLPCRYNQGLCIKMDMQCY